LNGWFGDFDCNTTMSVPHLRAYAASANTRNGYGSNVRLADVSSNRGECPLCGRCCRSQFVVEWPDMALRGS
jgi:hypothetical protein